MEFWSLPFHSQCNTQLLMSLPWVVMPRLNRSSPSKGSYGQPRETLQHQLGPFWTPFWLLIPKHYVAPLFSFWRTIQNCPSFEMCTFEPVKAGTNAWERRALQQLDLNVHVKLWPDMTCPKDQMYQSTNGIVHTSTFVIQAVEWEIAQCVHQMASISYSFNRN